ncbi:hypothetical protein DSO57_1032453 [Entomophthora muscae]|uniref:Uncharacterized protein n=1 Tax=Entomophthora muscae TaxID=34485 RepID=A0ACC2RR95_9FUNG|nr:hypothetical protein DSO57_1032453 [Entomophthora muscae]
MALPCHTINKDIIRGNNLLTPPDLTKRRVGSSPSKFQPREICFKIRSLVRYGVGSQGTIPKGHRKPTTTIDPRRKV